MGDSQYVPGVKGIGSSADGMDGDEENHEINQVIFMSMSEYRDFFGTHPL